MILCARAVVIVDNDVNVSGIKLHAMHGFYPAAMVNFFAIMSTAKRS